VTGATALANFPPELRHVTWTAVFTGGATGATSGVGDITEHVSLPVGATITYTIQATVAKSARGRLVSTAVLTPPEDVLEARPADNLVTDVDVLLARFPWFFAGRFGRRGT
jgi:hypothetical protein